MRRLLCVTLLILAVLTGAAPAQAQARHLRVASAFDPQTMDPHALALLYQFFPKLTQGTASFIEFGWTATPTPGPR